MGAPHVHVHRGLLRAAASEARLWDDGYAGEPLLTDAEPALHWRVAVSGPQCPAVGGRRGEVPGVDIGCGVSRAERCVSPVRQRMFCLHPLRDLAEHPHRWGPLIEMAVTAGDNAFGVARVGGRVLQDGVLGRRPVRPVQ